MKTTEIFSIYAATLSTIVFIWNVTRSIPKFKVSIVFGTEEIDGEYISGIYISIKNPSPHTVHLSNILLLYPYEKSKWIDLVTHAFKYRRFSRTVGWVHTSLSNYELDDKFPLALESGQSHNVFVPDEILEKILENSYQRKIKAVVTDQLWRKKYSRNFEYLEAA
jgi:hypothetical protein